MAGGAIVVLVTLSAFFSSSETAIFSLPVERISERAAGGEQRAALLSELREDPHKLLVTLLVGNNLVNVALSSIVTHLLSRVLPPGAAVTAATLVATSLILVFGEIVPKSYGLDNAEEWALRVARPVRLVERGLYPLVALFDAITRSASQRLGGDTDIEEQYLDD